MSLDLSFSNISNHINNVGIGQRGYCFLMDRMGHIMYHPQQQLLYAGLKSEDTAALAALKDGTYVEDTVIYAVTSVEDSSWRVVGVSFVDELVNRSVREMIGISAGLAGLVLAAALLTSWILVPDAEPSPVGAGLPPWSALSGTPTTFPTARWGAPGRCGSSPSPLDTWCCGFSSSCPLCGRRRSICARLS